MGQSVRFRAPAEQVLRAVAAALGQRGVQLVQSFDLQAARARHPDPRDCACPQHGTAECTCQYVVALAYSPRAGLPAAPQVLTVHAYEQGTLVTVHSDQGTDGEDRLAVMAAILEAAAAQAADPCTGEPDPCPPARAEP